MKFTAVFSLAFAAFALAQEFDLEKRIEGDVTFSKEDLDAAEGLTLDFTGPVIKPVSTKCAAHPRDVDTCPAAGVSAHLVHPSKRVFIHGIKQQRCANTCTCRPTFGGGNCLAFAWNENSVHQGRGLCILYSESLTDMGMTTAPRATTDNPQRTFWSRSCFVAGKPYPTGPIATDTPKLAEKPVSRHRRAASLQNELVAALERV